MKSLGVAAGACGLIGLAIFLNAADPKADDQLAQHRNLGKAFYENPTTQAEAVAEFKKALDLAPGSAREKLNYALALMHAGKQEEGVELLKQVQRSAPDLPHTWFNLGIYYKKSGETGPAITQFEHLEKLAPEEPVVHYQLGSLYRAEGRAAEAQAQFERAAKLNPLLAAPHFQLYNLYRQAGRQDDAAKSLAEFQRLKKQQEGAAIPEDVDWCNFAEIYDPPGTPAAPPAPDGPYETRILPGAATGYLPIDSTGAHETDLLTWSPRGLELYRHGTQRVADAGLGGVTGVISVAAGDFNNDGLADLVILTDKGPLLYRNEKGRFVPQRASLPQRVFTNAVWIDYDHDYDLDLVLLGDTPALLRNEGAAGFSDRTSDFPFQSGAVTGAFKTRIDPDSKAFDLVVEYRDRGPVVYRDDLGGRYHIAPGPVPRPSPAGFDFDRDGRPDRVTIAADGQAHVLLNRSRAPRRWITVSLAGVKSLKTAQDAQVEIKTGALYHRTTYEGYPIVFDAAAYPSIDTVRITWPNGLIQNEIRQPTNKPYVYTEAQRLSGSCPMIWTWNGNAIEFITDVLGVAPLGASDGEGTYFPVDHDEYVSIPGSALAGVNGQYDLRVTEELSEVSYIDQIELAAIDHPAGGEIFTNEKFKGPPYPEFRLFEVRRRIYPKSARDGAGRDVLPQISKRDGWYPDTFERTQLGVAKLHSLELDFSGAAPGGDAVLLLNGWVDWPDGSTFRAASQEIKGGLVMPYLEMQDASGEWKTVDPDMGMPAGKPKTIVVRLHFPSASRKVRIVTNLCVYWDEIFLSEGESAASFAQVRKAEMASADLHFRGFSETRIHPERKQPDSFFYDHVSPVSFWNPTSGMYTRYGDVLDLLRSVDDRLVIIGSGDEIRLRFVALPPPPPGWQRDFLLKVDGWAKDRDPNTAFSSTVDPLPFHGMSRYPYPETEHFPNDDEHRRYRSDYNTRPALRLLHRLGGEAPRFVTPPE